MNKKHLFFGYTSDKDRCFYIFMEDNVVSSLQERKREQKRRRKRRVRRIKGALVCILLLVLGSLVFLGSRRVFAVIETMKIQQSEEYPESLQQLLTNNPEARQFVVDYPENKDKVISVDLSGEITKGRIPLFLQWDERWGYEFYGNDFLAVTGCGPTCLSMVYSGLTGETDGSPSAIARMAEKQGYYVAGSGSSWELMSEGAEGLGLQVENVSFDEEHIRSFLAEGNPIICIMGPGDFTTSGHFIVLTGVDDNGDILVNDPNSRKRSEKAWKLSDLMPQIRNLWGYTV